MTHRRGWVSIITFIVLMGLCFICSTARCQNAILVNGNSYEIAKETDKQIKTVHSDFNIYINFNKLYVRATLYGETEIDSISAIQISIDKNVIGLTLKSGAGIVINKEFVIMTDNSKDPTILARFDLAKNKVKYFN